MATLNKVMLIGNLTRDAELKYTAGGVAIASFGLAVNDYFKNSAGEKQERAHFVDCTMFGSRAETASKFFEKGKSIFVEGRLDYQTWEAKDGGKRSKLAIVVDNFQLLSSGKGAAEASAEEPVKAKASSKRKSKTAASSSDEQDGWEGKGPF